MKRLHQPEQENGKLKKLLAERDLEIDVMKEVSAKLVAHSCVVGRLRSFRSVVCRSDGVRADVGGQIDLAIWVAGGKR